MISLEGNCLKKLNGYTRAQNTEVDMIYTDMSKKAMRIAFDAHKEQTDKSGLPYIYHPVHLAEQMEDEISACAALLHDVVEDTPVTFESLRQEGISDDVIDVLRLLTHDGNVPYMDYIKKIKESGNSYAIRVKLADLIHNSDPARLIEVNKKDIERLEKYKAAISLLKG
jgi:(p)ppGpp synthase/HD superfamily hydrolase